MVFILSMLYIALSLHMHISYCGKEILGID